MGALEENIGAGHIAAGQPAKSRRLIGQLTVRANGFDLDEEPGQAFALQHENLRIGTAERIAVPAVARDESLQLWRHKHRVRRIWCRGHGNVRFQACSSGTHMRAVEPKQ